MSALVLSLTPLLQGVRPDTVVMVPARDAFDYIQAGTIGLVVVILALLLMVLIRVFQTVESLSRSIDPLVDRAAKGLDPVLERARSVSENVDYVSHAIRRDVEGLTEALDRIRGRLDQASDRMEERIDEFNALMELVQSEAEEIFLDTAATVRGVRAGSRSLMESDGGGRRESDGERGRGRLPDDGSESGGDPSGAPSKFDAARPRPGDTRPRPGPAPAPGTLLDEEPGPSSPEAPPTSGRAASEDEETPEV
ncbi:MAG: hypothetical protein R3223_12890 [Longimicrobiales bacterium]|nr:hypothetical protein [Longimicrobiales bacterium]